MKLALLRLLRFCVQLVEKAGQHATNCVFLRYCFSAFFTSVLCSKIVHLYAHASSISISTFLIWGSTFFLQDVVLIFLVWFLVQRFQWRWSRIVASFVVIVASFGVSVMAAANISFFVVTGAEIHWRQAKGFHTGPAAIKTLVSELAALLVGLAVLLAIAWLSTDYVYQFTGEILAILTSSARSVFRCWRKRSDSNPYEPVPAVEEGYYNFEREDGGLISLADFRNDASSDKPGSVAYMKRLAVLLPTTMSLVLSCIRPPEPAYSFLSLSLPFAPLVGGKPRHPESELEGLLAGGNYFWLTNQTALAGLPDFDFLPHGRPLPGFRDWSSDANKTSLLHYSPTQDPLHISNLENEVLQPLRQALSNGSVKIKHVFLIKLESTRADVFPLRKHSFFWDRIAETYPNKHIPAEVEERLANLTRTAEYLTGFDSGFEEYGHRKKSPYGGISASNAFTTATYTVKSIPGTFCGVTPLVADFNREYQHHIYQPCLPHIFNMLNQLPDTANQTEDFTAWPWHTMWMQSVTDTYDHQDDLLPVMGFHDVLNKEVIEDPTSKYYPPKSGEVNYYGYPDTEIRPYLHDAIRDAQRNNKRLFIGHLTGTTHHAWGIPNKKYLDFLKHSWYGANLNVNKYLNSVLFVDRWLNDILELLEDTGIANETLVVFTGDHAISLPNDGSPTPYDNPHIGSFHVPLVFSHPHLPPLHVTTPVILHQVLPTILDLLIESSSLSPNSTHAVKQLLSIYEGQSIIRPLITQENSLDEVTQKPIKKDDWQFTTMNTGGSWLAVRSAAEPDYRLVVPLIPDLEWRFTDLKSDPNELEPILEFELVDLVRVVEKSVGRKAASWVGDAARVARWWVGENWRRWEFHPKGPR
ncbi:hypothetical protein VTO42DRAFT_1292 [Malbranchea cinnamomea]